MARHMRNGRDYSRPGPKVDYELRKDSNNAARSGEVYDKIEDLSDSIAPQYDPSKTYGNGWVRMYHNKRYRSNQAITEPEPWTPEHWTEENLDIAITALSERLSEYKIKEYVFEYTKTSVWATYDIEESNAFLDGSGYLDVTNQGRFPLNYASDNYRVTCAITYKNGATKIEFMSNHAGTIHAFVRYK